MSRTRNRHLIFLTLLALSWRAGAQDAAAPVDLAASAPEVAASAAAPVTVVTLADPVPSRRSARLNQLPALLGLPAVLPVAETGKSVMAPSLSLVHSMDLGVGSSLDVQAAQAHQESYDWTRKAALGSLLPRLDSRVDWGRGQLESELPYARRIRKAGSVTLHQPLVDLGAYHELQRQTQLAESARILWGGASSAAGLEVASAYLQALQSRLTMALSREHETLLTELLTYVTERANAGGTSNAERDRVRARVANARSLIADAGANLKAALRNLESLLGQVPEALAVEVPTALEIPFSVAEARDVALQDNHELRAARAEADAMRHEEKTFHAHYLPTLAAEVSHTRNVNGAGGTSYYRDTKAMLVLNWSMLNGGTDRALANAAASRRREKTLKTASSERRLTQELESAYASLDALHDRFAAVTEELTANQTVVNAFRAQMVGGNRQLLDVLDADQRLYQSRLDLVQLAITEVQNHIKVAHLTGQLPSLLNGASAEQPGGH